MLFFSVALFATRHEISLGGFTAAYDRDQVIHGKLPWREPLAAVMADPLGALSFPPLAGPQLLGFTALAADLLLTDGHKER